MLHPLGMLGIADKTQNHLECKRHKKITPLTTFLVHQPHGSQPHLLTEPQKNAQISLWTIPDDHGFYIKASIIELFYMFAVAMCNSKPDLIRTCLDLVECVKISFLIRLENLLDGTCKH